MKIGIALGGGGVLGIAHLALLEELEKNDIEISAIAGTSAGAIIGGLYAFGGAGRVWQFFEILREKQLLTRKGLILAGRPEHVFERIEETLAKVIDAEIFSKLKIPLAVVTTDIDEGVEEVIKSGPLVKAIMASAAYPGVFPYQELNGKRLVDGGVTNNLPTDVARAMGCDFVIASSLNQLSPSDRNTKLNRAGIAARALDIMQLEQEKIQLSLADYCYLPPIQEYRWFHYEKIDEIYEKSKNFAQSSMPRLRRIIAENAIPSFLGNIFNG